MASASFQRKFEEMSSYGSTKEQNKKRKILPDGESKIKSALDGLVGKGYVSKTQSKESNGKFGRNIIEVNERPLWEKPLAENPVADNRVTEKPITCAPLAEKDQQYSNKKYNINECMLC